MTTVLHVRERPIEYPGSDGEPSSNSDLRFEWISTIKWNLDDMLRNDPAVYVAADLPWYPVEGRPELCVMPAGLVAFGPSKRTRGSYKQWEEGGIAPQVVFDVICERLSSGSRVMEMTRKLALCGRYGVEEYYVLNPGVPEFDVWTRSDETGLLEPCAEPITTWTSMRLSIRFDRSGDDLVVYRPNGERFQSYLELADARRRAGERAEAEAARVARLEARLRELGVDPDAA
jgi:hypothetical protein